MNAATADALIDGLAENCEVMRRDSSDVAPIRPQVLRRRHNQIQVPRPVGDDVRNAMVESDVKHEMLRRHATLHDKKGSPSVDFGVRSADRKSAPSNQFRNSRDAQTPHPRIELTDPSCPASDLSDLTLLHQPIGFRHVTQ